MESYKHSCPFCGQHIEYTADYCGRQMQCPSCGKTVTFPAIPPSRGAQSARVRDLDSKAAEGNPATTKPRPVSKKPGFLRDFEHWNLVWQCAVPFVLIGLLLAGAVFVKNKLGDNAAPAATPAVQADPTAWQRNVDLTKADQTVRSLIRELEAAHAMEVSAQRAVQQAATGDALQRRSAEQQAQAAQNTLAAVHKRMEDALENYRQLGGTVDYRNQIRNY
jgi:endogenous inhibitor of DNA gyrase (YacG/DUF329 family)